MNFGVVVFPGTWSDCDFHYVIGEVLHQPVRYVWHRDADLTGFDCLILPGGFSYGDYLRAGAIAGRSPVVEALGDFAASGGLVLGSCNGFQILCEAGLLPGALTRNDHLEFRCDWISMRVESERSPWAKGLNGRVLRMPIAHGEGNYYVDARTRERLSANGQIIFRYCDAEGNVTSAANPNGSLDSIAGVCDERGNVLGLMPHPERCSEPLIGGADGLLVLRALDTGLARPVLSGVFENR